jgi:hypothetical protein
LVRAVQFIGCRYPLHPYVLGVLLGDASFRRGVILASTDQDVLGRVSARLPTGDALKHLGRCSYRVTGRRTLKVIKDLGLYGHYSYEQFIPQQYLYGSVHDRLALLQGLLDTDGCAERRQGTVTFSSTSPGLVEGVTFLVQSLGGTARCRERATSYTDKNGERRDGRPSWELNIRLPRDLPPFQLPRKLSLLRERTAWGIPRRQIVDILPDGEEEAQCIRVDAPDSLYVSEHCVVTHNTVLAIATAREAGLNCVLLRPEKIKGGIVGESERRLAKALGGIESLAPCLAFIDELDQRFQRGQGGGDGGAAVESNLFGRLLEFFGDPSHRGRIVSIATSNRPDLVDAALFRPGRFDVKIPLLPPETAEERAEVFGAALRRYGHPEPDGLLLARCGERTESWTQAEIERAVVKANGLARLRRLPIAAALDEALALLRPATRDVRLMTALAVAECDDASLLPARYRALLEDRDALDAEIARRTADEARPRGRQARTLDV